MDAHRIIELDIDEKTHRAVQYPRVKRQVTARLNKSPFKLNVSLSEKFSTDQSIAAKQSTTLDKIVSEITVKRLVAEDSFSKRRSCPSLESKLLTFKNTNELLNSPSAHSLSACQGNRNIKEEALANQPHNDSLKISKLDYKIHSGDAKDEELEEAEYCSKEYEYEKTDDSKEDEKKEENIKEEEYVKREVQIIVCPSKEKTIPYWKRNEYNDTELTDAELKSTLKVLRATLRHKMTELDVTRKKLEQAYVTGARRLNSINDLRNIVRLLQTRYTDILDANNSLLDHNYSLSEAAAESKSRLSHYMKENIELKKRNEELETNEQKNTELLDKLDKKIKSLESSIRRKDVEMRHSSTSGNKLVTDESKKLNDQIRTAYNRQQVQERKLSEMTKAIQILVKRSYERRLHSFLEAQSKPQAEVNLPDTTMSQLASSYKMTAEERRQICLEEINEIITNGVHFGNQLGEYLFTYTTNDFI